MESYIQNYGQYNTIVDGNIIDETKWNMVYDGDVLDLEARHNDEAIYMNLNNDEIMKLLEVPANKKTIHERLELDLHNKKEDLQIQPIIIEEVIVDNTSKPKYTRKKHHKKYKKHKTKSSKPSKKRSSKGKKESKKITPDYLKTIY
jgi:hypothetical protein|tara:strand:- start:800 stop:1237 length:438 start_codon:yes stop_codon:yes gene_type:complete